MPSVRSFSVIAAITAVSCASSTPRAVAVPQREATARPDAGARVVIPPSTAGPAPHAATTHFSAADPSLRLGRVARVEGLRDEALMSGVPSSAIRVTDFAGGAVTLVGWTERAPASDAPQGEAPDEESEDDIPDHAFAWLVADDGAVTDVSEHVASADHDPRSEDGQTGAPAATLARVQLTGDPTREIARLGDDESATYLYVRLTHGRFSTAEGCGSNHATPSPSACGPSLRCGPDTLWQAIIAPDGELLTDDPCSRGVLAIDNVAQTSVTAAVEATDAARHEVWSNGSPPLDGPTGSTCRRVPARAQRTMARRLLRSVHPDPDIDYGADFDPHTATVHFGCVDRGGRYLALVSSEDDSYHVLFRAGRGAPQGLASGPLRHPMAADLTGDGIPEFVWLDGTIWSVMSVSWADSVAPRDEDDTARSGRRFVVVTDGDRAGLILNSRVAAWNGQEFAPVTQGFDALRAALAREEAAISHSEALELRLRESTPAWSAQVTAPCDDATRVAWTTDVARHLLAMGLARPRALELATAPHALAACPPSSAWGRAVGAL